jgi:hypothetical protein
MDEAGKRCPDAEIPALEVIDERLARAQGVQGPETEGGHEQTEAQPRRKQACAINGCARVSGEQAAGRQAAQYQQ